MEDIFREDISPERHFLKDKISKDIFSEDRNPGTFSQGHFLKDIHIRIQIINQTCLLTSSVKYQNLLHAFLLNIIRTSLK